jgi:hypothetical protein
MLFIVERYLPGLDRAALQRSLDQLEQAVAEMRGEGTAVRYLGSTIVPDDEACFCQFEASAAADIAEANRRAGVPFDRIVDAVAAPTPVREEER